MRHGNIQRILQNLEQFFLLTAASDMQTAALSDQIVTLYQDHLQDCLMAAVKIRRFPEVLKGGAFIQVVDHIKTSGLSSWHPRSFCRSTPEPAQTWLSAAPSDGPRIHNSRAGQGFRPVRLLISGILIFPVFAVYSSRT